MVRAQRHVADPERPAGPLRAIQAGAIEAGFKEAVRERDEPYGDAKCNP